MKSTEYNLVIFLDEADRERIEKYAQISREAGKRYNSMEDIIRIIFYLGLDKAENFFESILT